MKIFTAFNHFAGYLSVQHKRRLQNTEASCKFERILRLCHIRALHLHDSGVVKFATTQPTHAASIVHVSNLGRCKIIY